MSESGTEVAKESRGGGRGGASRETVIETARTAPNRSYKGDKDGNNYSCEHQVCREALVSPPPPLLTPLLTPRLLPKHLLLDEDDRGNVSRPALLPSRLFQLTPVYLSAAASRWRTSSPGGFWLRSQGRVGLSMRRGRGKGGDSGGGGGDDGSSSSDGDRDRWLRPHREILWAGCGLRLQAET